MNVANSFNPVVNVANSFNPVVNVANSFNPVVNVANSFNPGECCFNMEGACNCIDFGSARMFQ